MHRRSTCERAPCRVEPADTQQTGSKPRDQYSDVEGVEYVVGHVEDFSYRYRRRIGF